jgi:hypothetical protein
MKTVPSRIIIKPRGKAAKGLARLYDEADAATAAVAARTKDERDAIDLLRAAERAVATSQAGSAGDDINLMRSLQDCQLAANPDLHGSRKRAAELAQERAVDAIENHIVGNVAALIEELRPEAERAAREANEQRAALAPFEAAYDDVANRVRVLAAAITRGRTAPPERFVGNVLVNADETRWDPYTSDAWQLPADRSLPPLPDARAVEAVHAE